MHGAYHGEYKVPGGKLVVVDLDTEDGVLRGVRVAGDFFLEPDEAILEIDRALEGAPVDTDAAGTRPSGRCRTAGPPAPCSPGGGAASVGWTHAR